MTSRDITQLINCLLWNAESMLTNMGASGAGAREVSSQITTAITGVAVRRGRQKHMADPGTETLENVATAKKEEKGKAKEGTGDIKTSWEHLLTPSEPKFKLKSDNSTQSAQSLTSKIEETISSGCVVLVHGWEPSPLHFFVEENIGMYRPPLSQEVSIQDAVKHAKQQAHKSKADLSDIHRTVMLKYLLGPFSDNVNTRLIPLNDCYLPREGPDMGKECFGMHTIHGDAERLQGWDLMSHGGFLTYPHHDAGGLCMYITVQSGTKVWGYFNMGTGSTTTRKELFNAWDDILLLDQEMNFKNHPLRVILLAKGYML
ncbi:hypothetical protein PISMIDRAFT_22790 [Pisolithus microcarpus 441]|uniref:JmjC domain-containing protein n=1 Tax=Pisolithus microcarpus 441 TaxID=765257 RepID=A0A0C9YL31_9AGAM|nr:hypothetical protein BKA83DRAFT_22790 [Pisolithus microcarpus]KIK25730.1 hypothetical protein PISMIDRAFT_22790 [Pisolithus microcarpus 441]